MDRLHRAYRRAESQLISVLERRKGEVQTFYGDLMLADGVYGGSQSRRWKVDWNKTPQPIQVKLMSLRGVRDKLPGQGHFHYCVSLWYNVVSLIALSLYYERLCLSNGCCVILINDHWYSNLPKENFFLWTMLFDIRWKICLDGITLQPAWRSQHEMVKVERSNLGRSHITNKPWWPILQCGNEGQFCLVL